MNTETRSRTVSAWSWIFLAVFALVVLPMSVTGEAPPAETYVVTFKPMPPFAPKTAAELLAAFKENHPPDVATHDFRTVTQGGGLVGLICVDGAAGRDAVQAMLGQSKKLALNSADKATTDILQKLLALGQPALEPAGGPPRIIATVPPLGAVDVDPALPAITVTFNVDMGGGMSWTGGGTVAPKGAPGQRAQWRDKRTCALPVALEPGKFYRIGINSSSRQNFRSAAGLPVNPSAIYFVTRGAGNEEKQKAIKPAVAKLEPSNGATDVDPNLAELRITFNVPMGGGRSLVGGGPNFPGDRPGSQISWTPDQKTCVMPVQLKPGWEYRLGLNSPSHTNFQSPWGVPLDPVVYSFKTRK